MLKKKKPLFSREEILPEKLHSQCMCKIHMHKEQHGKKLKELFALVFTLEESLLFLYGAKAEGPSCVQVLVGAIL